MDDNRRDSGCRPFFCTRCNSQLVRWKAGSHGQVTQMTNLSGRRRVFTDESHQNATCPAKGGFSRTNATNPHLSGRRRVLTDVFEKSPHPTLHARDDLHDEKKQGRAAVGKRDEKIRADADGEQD